MKVCNIDIIGSFNFHSISIIFKTSDKEWIYSLLFARVKNEFQSNLPSHTPLVYITRNIIYYITPQVILCMLRQV